MGGASSVRTPRLARGCRKQIIPASPLRGFWSTSSTPFCLSPSSSESTSGVWKQMWCSPSPLRSRNFPTGDSGDSGSSSSISLWPMVRSAAFTPCSFTLAEARTGSPSVSL